jgi:hypothetical protein
MIGSIAASPAWAQGSLEGRWRDDVRNVSLDIRSCDGGWCGIAVEGEKCGRQTLQLTARSTGSPPGNPEGFYALAGAGDRYPVQAAWQGSKLLIVDNTKGDLALLRRSTSPVILNLVRSGPSACAATPAS